MVELRKYNIVTRIYFPLVDFGGTYSLKVAVTELQCKTGDKFEGLQ